MWIAWFVIFAFKNFYEIQKNKLYIYIFSSIFRIINELLIRTHELFFYPITTFFALQIWGVNFYDSFNKGSFVLAIIVMLYFLYYYYRYYHTINKDNEEPSKIFRYEKNSNLIIYLVNFFLIFKRIMVKIIFIKNFFSYNADLNGYLY